MLAVSPAAAAAVDFWGFSPAQHAAMHAKYRNSRFSFYLLTKRPHLDHGPS